MIEKKVKPCNRRRRAMVGIVTPELQAAGACVEMLENKGATPQRDLCVTGLERIGNILPDMPGQDSHNETAVDQKTAVRFDQIKGQHPAIDLDALDQRPHPGRGTVMGGEIVEGKLHVRGGDRPAVVPAGIVSQPEPPLAPVRRRIPGQGQLRQGLQIRIKTHQCIVGGQHGENIVAVVDQGIGHPHLHGRADAQPVGRWGACGPPIPPASSQPPEQHPCHKQNPTT